MSLEGFINTDSFGEPELVIPRTSPATKFTTRDLDDIAEGLQRNWFSREAAIHGLSPLVAHHNRALDQMLKIPQSIPRQ